jgi:hypothetical protein
MGLEEEGCRKRVIGTTAYLLVGHGDGSFEGEKGVRLRE